MIDSEVTERLLPDGARRFGSISGSEVSHVGTSWNDVVAATFPYVMKRSEESGSEIDTAVADADPLTGALPVVANTAVAEWEQDVALDLGLEETSLPDAIPQMTLTGLAHEREALPIRSVEGVEHGPGSPAAPHPLKPALAAIQHPERGIESMGSGAHEPRVPEHRAETHNLGPQDGPSTSRGSAIERMPGDNAATSGADRALAVQERRYASLLSAKRSHFLPSFVSNAEDAEAPVFRPRPELATRVEVNGVATNSGSVSGGFAPLPPPEAERLIMNRPFADSSIADGRSTAQPFHAKEIALRPMADPFGIGLQPRSAEPGMKHIRPGQYEATVDPSVDPDVRVASTRSYQAAELQVSATRSGPTMTLDIQWPTAKPLGGFAHDRSPMSARPPEMHAGSAMLGANRHGEAPTSLSTAWPNDSERPVISDPKPVAAVLTSPPDETDVVMQLRSVSDGATTADRPAVIQTGTQTSGLTTHPPQGLPMHATGPEHGGQEPIRAMPVTSDHVHVGAVSAGSQAVGLNLSGVATAAPATGNPARSVAQQIGQAMVTRSASETILRLEPEELGRVTLSLRGDERSMMLVVHADRSETLELIRRNIQELASELSDLGYEDIAFDFAGSGDREEADSTDHAGEPPAQPEEQSQDVWVTAPSGGRSEHGHVDIRI